MSQEELIKFMWIFNVILILTLVGFVTWLFWNFGDELMGGVNILISGMKSTLFVLVLLLVQGVKSLVFGAVVGGIFWGIFKIAGAPIHYINSVPIAAGALCFSGFMLKFVIEDWNDLIRSFRHDVRNTYRNQRRRS